MELNYWLCLGGGEVKFEVFLSLKEHTEEWASDLANRRSHLKIADRVCPRAGWMVPTEVPYRLSRVGAAQLGATKGLLAVPEYTYPSSPPSSKPEVVFGNSWHLIPND